MLLCCSLLAVSAGCGSASSRAGGPEDPPAAYSVEGASAYADGVLYHSDLGYSFQRPASWDAEEAVTVQQERGASQEDAFLCGTDTRHPLLIIGQASRAAWDAGKIHPAKDYTLIRLADAGETCYYAKIAQACPAEASSPDLYNSMLLPQAEVKKRFTLIE